MSGGVDSSVAAYLLKQKGYKVIGLFMKNWESQPNEECTSEIDFKDAEKVCDILNIPLHGVSIFQMITGKKYLNFFFRNIKKVELQIQIFYVTEKLNLDLSMIMQCKLVQIILPLGTMLTQCKQKKELS